MKEMNIEKRILKGLAIDGVIDVEAKTELDYRRESGGMRAVGPVIISGHCRVENEVRSFSETLELDVLAPRIKLSNSEPFTIEVLKVKGVADDGILLMLDLGIHGIEDNKTETLPPALDELAEKPVPVQAEPTVQAVDETAPAAEEAEADFESIEDLFDDADNVYTRCSLGDAKADDTYGTIAGRYQVDVNELRNVNKNKGIEPKMLIMLP